MSGQPSPGSLPLFDLPEQAPDFHHENALLRRGLRHVCGVDEAGRGPLAGPVVAAAVILDPDAVPAGLNDSKQLSAAKRDILHDRILNSALAVGIASASAEEIDQLNILEATMRAMERAVAALAISPDHALIDGNRLPAGLACPAQALVRGDARSVSIAAASIIAKVTRDRMMIRAGAFHPAYGFEAHKGYGGAARHRDAMAIHGGVARLHRFTFAPLKR